MTPAAIVLALVLSVVMGAANVYLGLRVGMTVSAAIPAAVMALAILNGLMRRTSILEANMVQTGASAGEALAAGVIFTLPAMVLVGVWREFDFWTTTAIAAAGGVLGSLLMIPMRKALIVDSPELPYPEGVACAEVLRTAERATQHTADSGAGLIFGGLALGAVFKGTQSFLGLMKGGVEAATLVRQRVVYVGADVAPALIAVGAIVGLPIASQVFLGGVISWLIAIPLAFPVEAAADAPANLAKGLWSTQVRYLGVGAMLVGGVVSIWRVRSGLIAAVRELRAVTRGNHHDTSSPGEPPAIARTERNLGAKAVAVLATLTTLVIAGVYYSLLQSAPVTIVTTVIMLLMAFFFTAVASYLVGLVGSSNSPVSGMTITAVLGTGGLLYVFREVGFLELDALKAIVATLGVAGIICCVASTSGDTSNDLKTGLLVGATPRNQQIMQVMCVLAASLVMAPVLTVLHEGSLASGAGGIGGAELPAPQAVLFSNLAQGMFGNGELPWSMIGAGMAIGVGLLLADALLHRLGIPFRLHVMPVAVGMYLPFGVAPPILLGGVVHYLIRRAAPADEYPLRRLTLAASGVIAGESLVGVALGLFAWLGYASWGLGEALHLSDGALTAISLLALLGAAVWMYRAGLRRTS